MDNQQRRIEDRLNWLGGIFDGEGMVTATKRGSNKKHQNSFVPILTITNTDLVIINEVISILEELNIPHFVHSKKDHKNPQWKIRYEVRVAGIKRCKIALPILIPYLVGKRVAAESLLKFCSLRLSRPHNYPYTEEEFNLLKSVRKTLTRVNYFD